MPPREIGMRLGLAAAGAGAVALAFAAGDPVTRLLSVVVAVAFLGPLAVLLTADARARLGRRPQPPPGPVTQNGRPRPAEWAFVLTFDAVFAVFLAAGVLDVRRGGSGELLATGVLLGVMVLFLTAGFLSRAWQHHQRRPRD